MTRLLAALLVALLPAAARAADPPHILFLLADDWRWDTLGCAGSVVRTPHLDALAARGVRFTECRVTTSICCVSRATLLTGQHMARHGVDRFGLPLTPEQWANTYPALLRAAGYHTGFVGKFGVGKLGEKAFDFQRVYEGVHWMPDGKDKAEKVHVTAKNERDALAFLAARPKDRPFALSVSFFAAHAEDKAPEQYLPQPWSARLYEGVTIPVPRTATDTHFKLLPPFLATEVNEGRVRWRKRFDTPERFQQYMTNYYRLASEADAVVGRLVEELRRQGVLDRTLIVFTGDNGYFHGERGLADKWFPYEEALRVPLIVCDPRMRPGIRGTTSDALVLNLDVAPTLLAAAGVRAPAGVQGRDVSKFYTAEKPPPGRDEFYYQHPVILGADRIPRSEAVVGRTIKYTVWPDFDFEELYDLRSDPAEERNLAGDPAHAVTLAGRRVALAAAREAAR
jgi:arylsulfatase